MLPDVLTRLVVRLVVSPYMQKYPGGIFQQDNALPHTARLTIQFFQQNNIQVLPWPSRSPDLAPYEHIWDYLGRQDREHHDVSSLDRMWTALYQKWHAMPQQTIRNVIASMRYQCVACVCAIY